MKRTRPKQFLLSTLPLLLLTACAGGGAVNVPDAVATVPEAKQMTAGQPFNFSFYGTRTIATVEQADSPQYEMLAGGGQIGSYKVVSEKFSYKPSWSNITSERTASQTVDAYKTPDGRLYHLGELANPLITGGFGVQNTNMPTRHQPQSVEGGGKLFVCCTNASAATFPAGYVNEMKYGVWMDKDGTADLFVGGVKADPAQMQGTGTDYALPRGKATYEVFAMRVKDGDVVTSSHDTSHRENSRLTVNFNTGKIGGTIKGNSDFGSDIVFKDVSVSGSSFAGTAESGSAAGSVDGAFYGSKGYYSPAGTEIGGKVSFAADKSLDSVFGGSRIGYDTETKSDTLDHLTQ